MKNLELNPKKSNDQRNDIEEDQSLAKESLIISKVKKLVLDNVHIKPTLSGKKTTGMLEVHVNGFRFSSSKG